ncbi:single-stranded-DNA-specific exonuclease RecJ [Campylobacter canadensis]|uniref:Single-stranded-DNA-specific exonuclease RecJ n=1 Tax=Campylobacter canadensis TaxID=449520 RepID=A0ABS7WUH5_9BACT|nr:single-stranded-DNA-specific exonuclease RecJ [Campylobacter canadensis]MBZ7987987.1 single-stranded-DNA-specific exonuclease RecJ [Campylobacter canadensis]MBZ7995427.1 single-stranded-DNA-specific exonuclease RecJ [Campylobacter canadensis]MBZ7998943.1 single-stranded-DNA-specific exonuclease RecJ [Campylobacter canadensis]MBZ8000749.1 single-stranded-DNA-specific exonuclease RecJ [Campylobacter canadensis]MBZ8002592.1 single-stranded-DNA-specific exonuclease RecJ [Campylobacter canadensi
MRKINKADINNLLSQRFKDDIHNCLKTIPQPEVFKDMQKATKRIAQAIKNNEKIAVIGDYDVDGIISSIIMSEFFDKINKNIIIKIPNRFCDGYGINENIVREIDASLIITVDNGITAFEAANLCEKLGKTLIITDHHEALEELPNAYAIINPKQKDCEFKKYVNCEICGAQVAWYLCVALKKELNLNIDMSEFLDILAIAIISDMMPLLDINRNLVKVGMNKINNLNRQAFKIIANHYKKQNFTYENISFMIAPLLNSSGRMDDASISFNFLKHKNYDDAYNEFLKIQQFNTERKEEEIRGFEQAKEFNTNDNFIVAYSNDWHKGVLGIIASRLAKEFNKPSFVFNIENNVAQGSARSVANIDLLEILNDAEYLFDNFGGHKGACGIKIKEENIKEFIKYLQKIDLNYDSFCNTNNVLGELELKEIDYELMNILNFYEPYGQANEKPEFILKNISIFDSMLINEKHLKCNINKNCEAIYFNHNNIYPNGSKINIRFTLGINNFYKIPKIQLNILDIF